MKLHRSFVIASGRKGEEGPGKRATPPAGVRARCTCATRVTESTDSPNSIPSRLGVTLSTQRFRCKGSFGYPLDLTGGMVYIL